MMPNGERFVLRKAVALGIAGSVSLLALAMASPGQSVAQHGEARSTLSAPDHSIGTFTPAVRDPRLAAELARRGHATALQFTPASNAPAQDRSVQVAVRVRPGALPSLERARPAMPGASAAVETPSGTSITPSTYNLGVAVGWRRFAITGDVAGTSGGAAEGSREKATVGVEYRANRRLTGRVQVAAERAEGVQQIVNDDRAVSLDVAGSYSIARNVAVTGGVRYRVSRDRLEPLARDERRDSQAVYIGTAVRF
jgi:hypothetical protein